jgi:hypothetical protein
VRSAGEGVQLALHLGVPQELEQSLLLCVPAAVRARCPPAE